MLKILVVDDDQKMHDLYVAALGELHDVQANLAYNGRQGYEYFIMEKPDLVIMDGQMPVMDGYDSIEQITSDFPDAKIVMLSWAPDYNAAVAAGALDARHKTYDHEELQQMICRYTDTRDVPQLERDTRDDEMFAQFNDEETLATAADPPVLVHAAGIDDHAGATITRIPTEAERAETKRLKDEDARLQKIADTRAGLLSDLRNLLDVFEANPEMELPSSFKSIALYFWSGDDVKDRMAKTRRAIGGKWDKNPVDTYFDLVTVKPGGLKITLTTPRENVCTRVVVGSEIVTETVPDPTVVASAPRVTVTKTKEKVEWVCPPSLVAD